MEEEIKGKIFTLDLSIKNLEEFKKLTDELCKNLNSIVKTLEKIDKFQLEVNSELEVNIG